jgi:hypothetical protein
MTAPRVYDIDAAATLDDVLEPLDMPRYLVAKADYDALAERLIACEEGSITTVTGKTLPVPVPLPGFDVTALQGNGVETKDAQGNPITLEAIRQRVADGIFLGGDYHAAYNEYLTAHRDRIFLLRLLTPAAK